MVNDQIRNSKYSVLEPDAWKNPFDYQVLHHGYLLTSCPGRKICKIFLYLVYEVLVNCVT